ncbi:MAG: acyltransferase family protein [Bacillota bacterium]
MSEQRNGPRLLYINNLRIVLIILIIMLHTAITYGASGSWYYSEPATDMVPVVLLTLFCAVVQSFALGLFFMLSGYFTPGSYSRKGAGAYLRDRFIRLGIPLVVYYFMINPLIVYILYVRCMGKSIPFENFFGSGPLWFVETLLLFALGYYLWRRLRRAESRERKSPRGSDLLKYAIILSLAGFLVRIWWPVGESFSNLQFGFFPGYIGWFVIGIAAYRNNWIADFRDSVGIQWLIISGLGILLLPVIMLSCGATESVTPFLGGLTWQSFVYSTWEAFVGTGLVAGLLVVFRRRFNRQARFTKLLADNVYTVYIIHAPVIVFFAYTTRGVHLYPLLKFVIAAVIGISLCFLISHFIVRRIPYSEKVL